MQIQMWGDMEEVWGVITAGAPTVVEGATSCKGFLEEHTGSSSGIWQGLEQAQTGWRHIHLHLN